MDYELDGEPLYSQRALEYLEEQQDKLDEKLVNGGREFVPDFAFIQGEIETLERYVEEIKPYHEVLQDAYEDRGSFRRGEVILGRIEDDMDLMARERDGRLNDTTPTGVSRRRAFDSIFKDQEYERPVLTDTWIIMNEAKKLRKSF